MRFSTRIAMLAVMLLALPLGLTAQKAAVPDRVPPKVGSFFSVSNAGEAWANFEQSPMGSQLLQLMKNPEIADDPDIQQLLLELEKAELELGFAVTPKALLGQHLDGLDLFLANDEMLQTTEILLVADFKDATKPAKVYQYIRGQLESQSAERQEIGLEPIQSFEDEMFGVKVTSAANLNLHFAAKDDVLLLSSSADLVDDSLSPEKKGDLAAMPGISSTFAPVGGAPGQISFFFGAEQFETIASMTPEGADVIDSIGLTGSAGKINVQPDRLEVAAFTKADAVPASNAATSQKAVLSFAGPRPLFAYSTNQFTREMIDQAELPSQLGPGMGNQVSGAIQMIGQLSEVFGPEFAIVLNRLSMSPQNPMALEIDLLLLAGIRDDAQATQQMTQFEQQIAMMAGAMSGSSQDGFNVRGDGPQVKEEQYGGTTIRSLDLPAMMGPPVAFTHARLPGGYVAVSTNVQSIKAAIDRSSSPDQNLTGGPLWGVVTESMPDSFGQLIVVDSGQVADLLALVAPMMMGQATAKEQQSMMQFMQLLKSAGRLYMATSEQEGGQYVKAIVQMK